METSQQLGQNSNMLRQCSSIKIDIFFISLNLKPLQFRDRIVCLCVKILALSNNLKDIQYST